MQFLKATLTDGSRIEFADSPIGSGIEKTAFLARDQRQVVCFFNRGLTDRMDRRRRLERILKAYNPTIDNAFADYWKTHFCWPTGLIDGDASIPSTFLTAHNLAEPPLAIVAPAYSHNFFFQDVTGSRREKNGRWFTGERARRLLPPAEKGNFLGYLQVCTKMARAVRRMHFAGLAHSDLSNKNVLIDPRGGDCCIIDIDSLVVPGFAPPTVIGTPGYIAPEVVARRQLNGQSAMPGIATDQYALGILIYECLLLRHPIMRQRPVKAGITSEQDELLAMGEMALFAEHPTDRSNWRKPPPVVPFHRVGPHLSKLFLDLFVHGLHDRARRPSAGDWEVALYRTFDNLHPSPNGSDWFVLAPSMPLSCPFTHQRLNQPVPIAYFHSPTKDGRFIPETGRTLTIYHHLGLMKWHTCAHYSPSETADKKRQGYFVFHQDRWWLVNESGGAMQVIEGPIIPHGEKVEIKKALRLRVSSEPNGRLLVFDFLRA